MANILSIVTINRNNANGLKQTMLSVLNQTCNEFEYIIIDGASTDDSKSIIEKILAQYANTKISVKWLSEPDKGIYDGMNKGMRQASGDWIQILNSGDVLADNNVVEKMLCALKQNNYPNILYGNMLKRMPNGRLVRDRSFAGREPSMVDFYRGTLNHDPVYIKKSLFDKYGYYDDSLRIVSDWKWYMKSIILGGEQLVYADIDVTIFDMTGISEMNLEAREKERDAELAKMLPARVLSDYINYHENINQIKRLKKYKWAYKLMWFMERVLFKFEKWFGNNKEQVVR